MPNASGLTKSSSCTPVKPTSRLASTRVRQKIGPALDGLLRSHGWSLNLFTRHVNSFGRADATPATPMAQGHQMLTTDTAKIMEASV
jgi:hypothetical protein